MTKKSVRGTETEKNLMRAFAGESQARTRYAFFAEKAREEGFEYIAKIFDLTVTNETEHAKLYFKQLEGGMLDFNGSYPAGIIGTTLENLKAAAEGEFEEWDNLYPEYGQVAQDEGFIHIAKLFRMIAEVEHMHHLRYMELVKKLESGTIFSSVDDQSWECMKCGHIHHGKSAPEICAVCGQSKAFFEEVCQ